MNAADVADDLAEILHSESEILERVEQLAAEIERDYEGKDLVLVGVLGGAAMLTVDLARALTRHVEIAWMAVRSYGSGTRSSGLVRLLKDLDIDVAGRHVLVVDGVIDTGLTAQWLVSNISSRKAASAHQDSAARNMRTHRRFQPRLCSSAKCTRGWRLRAAARSHIFA